LAKDFQSKGKKETPLMKQYNQIKAKYPGALLLFRVGDFYETFGEDAIKASKILEIVLTKRANGAASHIELAGFPHHALDSYLPKLVRAGNRVAICDQLEDPKNVKGIVKRGVTEMVTPGLAFHDQVLNQRTNNYLASLTFNKDLLGLALLDLSTGEFMVTQGNNASILKVIQSFRPSEFLYNKKDKLRFVELVPDVQASFSLDDWIFTKAFGFEKLTTHFNTTNLKGFGIEDLEEGIIAAGAVLQYLEDTEHKKLGHLSQISRLNESDYVWLDQFTIKSLELVFPVNEGGNTLIDILDSTHTPMGSRMMKKWVVMPLKDIHKIRYRLDAVDFFKANVEIRESIISSLKQICDIERLASKIATGRINPREFILLKRSIMAFESLKTILGGSKVQALETTADQINLCLKLLDILETKLEEEPPLQANQGNVIKTGVSEELDELRKIAFTGKDYLLQLQKAEAEKTGISSLKISYNKVFGYYLEVTHAHKDKVPDGWIRKQTLVNAERYITPELKEYEEKIVSAEDRLSVIESELFTGLIREAENYIQQLQHNASTIASIDCLVSFGEVAALRNYTKPTLSESPAIDIKNGRHPVIEASLPTGELYIPNDLYLDHDEHQILVITGPNMAGKSAILRQTALITLMAQMGSFVPAEQAELGIVDKVFTRVGASDNLSKGESTFMVEMTETASILHNVSDRSLILMDEIGRGTSTYDGLSIAWAIVEYLHNHPKYKAKTLFATHYHEMNQLTDSLRSVKNFNVSVKEVGEKVIFMRKLQPGGSQHSFGIHVAQMAGMPAEIVNRANEILHVLEKDKLKENHTDILSEIPESNFQLNLFEPDSRFVKIKSILESLDINTISPVEALLKLNEIQTLFRSQ
jgi:DNA mismatch repair protein MutS